ncbi:MAG: serine hydrolase, partial [Clostridia bacterium]|nr:serine hydrolase [Clostridia bacterium]
MNMVKMMHIFSRFLFPILLVVLLVTTSVIHTGFAETLDCSALSELPDYAWQKTASFPDWKDYTDDTLAMNSMISFQGYHGQGFLVLNVSEKTEAFTLYVNGVKADTGNAKGLVYIDISEAAKDGVNTVQISNILPLELDDAVTVHIPYPEVLPGNGESGGIHPLALKLVEDLIGSDVTWGFPGAQLGIVRNGREIYQNAWGRINAYEPDGTPKTDSPAVTSATLYDLASVTKMFSVNYAIQKLVTDGLLNINTPVVELLGDSFAADTLDFAYAGADPAPDLDQQIAWKREITPRALLAHQAGFPADPQYFKPDYDQSKQGLGSPGANMLYAVNREDTLKAIFRTPLMYEPGTQTKYSDVDYMLLGFIIERITGERLDAYMKKNFYEPLGLTRTTYLPLENGFTADDCAATELNGNTRDHHVSFPGIREQTLQGE